MQSLPAQVSRNLSPRRDKAAEVGTVKPLHSSLFPCWPLLPGDNVGEDSTSLVVFCFGSLHPEK